MNKIDIIHKNDLKNLNKRNTSTSKKIIAMVPVRAGSKRVPDKNIRPFGDTNLLELKLKLLKKINEISTIVVSTDCKNSAKIAWQQGVEVHWRNKYYAGSNITNDQHWEHIAQSTPGDIVFLAQVTSPLLRISTMQNSLKKFITLDNHDSINSVTSEKKFLWENGNPINYDINLTPKSQDLPNIVSLNFAITVIRKEVMIKRKNVIGYKPAFFELSKTESLDIDDLIDFKVAELMYRELGFDWLAN